MTSMSKHLLLIEDEAHLAFSLEFNLKEEGYTVAVAETLKKAKILLEEDKPELIILDVMLPDGTGFDFCAELRDRQDLTPVLMLTAKGSSDDIVAGFDAGADDYVTKPFALKELLSRIAAILRRQRWTTPNGAAQQQRLTFGDNTIDFVTREITIGSRRVELTDLEMRLLQFFADHEGRVIAREELLEKVWQVSPSTHTRTVDNFLVRLRRLFELEPGDPQHFLTIRGVGYRFIQNP